MISIIIPAFNHYEDALKPCLESLAKYTDTESVEVIVVANGCTDGTERGVRTEFPWCRLICFDEPLGYPKAVNRGIIASSGDYVVLLNSDTILLPQESGYWLDVMRLPMLTDPNIGVTGPLRLRAHELGRNFLVFFCVMIKREVFVRIGLLDERFGWGAGEDTAFCIEAENAGFKVMQVPDQQPLGNNGQFMVGNFPIYHVGEVTVHAELPNWRKLFAANGQLLGKLYGSS